MDNLEFHVILNNNNSNNKKIFKFIQISICLPLDITKINKYKKPKTKDTRPEEQRRKLFSFFIIKRFRNNGDSGDLMEI